MYKIGDFSKKISIPVKTLRYYDEINLFKPSYTDDFTGYRYYTDEQIEQIKKIIMLKELNLSLKDIEDYLKTGNLNIIENKGKEFRLKMEKIKKYIENVSYKIIKGNYSEYLKWNGYKCEDTPAALEIRDNIAIYYILLKNGKFNCDFLVFPSEENATNLNKMIIDDDKFNFCLKYLKSQYKYLTMTSCEQIDNSANKIRKYCKVIDEVCKQKNGYDGRIWKYIIHKVSLENDR